VYILYELPAIRYFYDPCQLCFANYLSKKKYVRLRSNSVKYIPLVTLCKTNGDNFDYDAFAKTASLSKDAHTINLMAGNLLWYLTGKSVFLKQPLKLSRRAGCRSKVQRGGLG